MKLLICFFGIWALIVSADDAESVQAKIARAMSAGPADIAKSARIVDTDAHGKMVVYIMWAGSPYAHVHIMGWP